LKIEIRNVKYLAACSEETSCFNATIYVDGKKVGTAQNHGHGGATIIRPWMVEQRINTYAATLPRAKGDLGDGHTFEYAQTAETLIDGLLTSFLIEKDLRGALSKRILYTKKDAKGIFETKALPAGERARLITLPAFQAKFQIDVILNAVPFDEALAIYKANGQ
jgi:hypothetical protein